MSKKDDLKREFLAEREKMHLQMLSSVSHDLKTPLASIIGSLEIHERLKASLTPEKRAELLGMALKEAYRLDRFITNILDMNRLEQALVKLSFQESDLYSLIQHVHLKIEDLVPAGSLTISGQKGASASIDSALVSRALSCLMENAYRHHKGDSPVKVDVTFQATKKQVTFCVKDNGLPIPPEQQQTIFEKYTRYTKTDHQNAGTGLGLAICKAICQLMGGDVTLSVDPQQGNSFVMTVLSRPPVE